MYKTTDVLYTFFFNTFIVCSSADVIAIDSEIVLISIVVDIAIVTCVFGPEETKDDRKPESELVEK